MRRSGFTLLEVVLATAISMLLVFGFYVALQSNLDLMQAGRDAVDEGTLARSLLNTMESDIVPALAPIAPAPTTSSSTTTDPTGMAPTTTTASTNPAPVFSIGVKGDSTTLSVYVTRMPRSLINPVVDETGTASIRSDIRRITYYLDGENGLIRQEVHFVTADNVEDPTSTTETDGIRDVLAAEVSSVEFRYFDGSSWVDSWDGAAMGEYGKSLLGPPRAIEITVSIQPPGTGEPKSYRHVVAFQTAPGVPAPATTTPSAP
jgi:hypothetical protein